MIIVPLNGDTIETAVGVPRRVISYSNLNSSGPVVRVRSTGTDLETVPFKEIQSVNGLSVSVAKNAKAQNVFSTDGYLKRASPLPQPGEVILSKVNGVEIRKYTVNRVRLHVKGRLSEGLIFECVEDDGTPVDLRVQDVQDIEGYVFSSKAFQRTYADYAGTGTNETAK